LAVKRARSTTFLGLIHGSIKPFIVQDEQFIQGDTAGHFL